MSTDFETGFVLMAKKSGSGYKTFVWADNSRVSECLTDRRFPGSLPGSTLPKRQSHRDRGDEATKTLCALCVAFYCGTKISESWLLPLFLRLLRTKSPIFDRVLFMLQRLMLYYAELCHSKGAVVWL